MKRKELVISTKHPENPTPNRKDLTTELAKFLKTEDNLVLPLKIKPVSGTVHSTLTVYVYNKKEDIPKNLSVLMEQRISGKKAAAPASAPPAPAK